MRRLLFPTWRFKSFTLPCLFDRRLRKGGKPPGGHLYLSDFEPCQDHDARPAASEASQATNELDVLAGPVGPKRTSGLARSPHLSRAIVQDHKIWDHSPRMLYSNEAVPLGRGPNFWNEDPLRRLLLLRWLQFSSRIPAIRGFCDAARSSPRLKCYDAPISMQVVIDSGEYFCVMIQQSSGVIQTVMRK